MALASGIGRLYPNCLLLWALFRQLPLAILRLALALSAYRFAAKTPPNDVQGAFRDEFSVREFPALAYVVSDQHP